MLFGSRTPAQTSSARTPAPLTHAAPAPPPPLLESACTPAPRRDSSASSLPLLLFHVTGDADAATVAAVPKNADAATVVDVGGDTHARRRCRRSARHAAIAEDAPAVPPLLETCTPLLVDQYMSAWLFYAIPWIFPTGAACGRPLPVSTSLSSRTSTAGSGRQESRRPSPGRSLPISKLRGAALDAPPQAARRWPSPGRAEPRSPARPMPRGGALTGSRAPRVHLQSPNS